MGQFTQFIELFAQPRPPESRRPLTDNLLLNKPRPKYSGYSPVRTNKHGQLLIHWGAPGSIELELHLYKSNKLWTCSCSHVRHTHHQHFWTSLLCTLDCLRELLKKISLSGRPKVLGKSPNYRVFFQVCSLGEMFKASNSHCVGLDV